MIDKILINFSKELESLTPRPILGDMTVLIPTIGRDTLTGCLLSIAKGASWPAYIVVVDQSSNDNVVGWLANLNRQGLNTLHITSTQRSPATARNRGLERVTTRFVAMTDDDCQVEHDWLVLMHGFLQAQPGTIFTGRVIPGGEGVVDYVVDPGPATYSNTRQTLRGNVMPTGNMGCALAVFKKIGNFDERNFLRSAEDNDWSYRALRAGIPIHYEPSICVTHLDWRDESQTVAVYRAYARSQGGVYGKFVRRGDWFMALRLMVDLGRALRRTAIGIIKGDQARIEHGKAYLKELLPGFLAGWQADVSA